MDKLEQYLEQVCRGIGGPRSLRQHVRQELREHLRDAAAQHRAAGMTEDQALARALADFGGPDLVRSELEATHGSRLLPVVIDKAMHWKEMTMRAKWLWTTWAYLALAAVIVLEVFFITFAEVFIVPRFQYLMRVGLIDPATLQEQELLWMPAFLHGLSAVTGHYTTQLLLLAAAVCGLFEWRVRSENKPFMRLAALGTAAVGLMVVVALTAGSLVIPFCLAMPELGRLARPFAVEQVAAIDTSVGALEQGQAKEDWNVMQEQANQALEAVHRLAHGPALTSLTSRNEPPTVEDLQAQLTAADEALQEALQAIRERNGPRLEAALRTTGKSFAPVREAAKRPAK